MTFVIFDAAKGCHVRSAKRVREFKTRDGAWAAERALNHRRRSRRFRVQLKPLTRAEVAYAAGVAERLAARFAA